MTVLFMARQTPSSVPALEYLIDSGVDVVFAIIRHGESLLQEICDKNNISYGNEDEFICFYKRTGVKIDWLLSFYWKKVKKSFLELPQKGCINFHPGPLPEARGSGYHIAIIENWKYWGVTAHYMDEDFDTGRIIKCEKFPLPDGLINRELVKIAHERLILLFKDIVDNIRKGEIPSAYEQPQGDYYSLAELEKSKYISDKDTAEIIDRKIRAFWNPPHTGAKIVLKGKEYTLVNQEILDYISVKSID